jgi:hypothetical protein
MGVAADLCVYTNHEFTTEVVETDVQKTEDVTAE